MPQVVLDGVVAVHAQEATSLCETRTALVRLPHGNLRSLERLDDRLLAHFDGLALTGERAQQLLGGEFDTPSRGAAFALAVRAIESGQLDSLERLWNVATDAPAVADALMTAFGWVDRRYLQGVVRNLLRNTDRRRRAIGLAACAMHLTDPGLETGPWLKDAAPAVRARALRAAGELGLHGLAPRCVAAMADDDAECQFWAAWSAVLLGNRGGALDALRRAALEAGGPHRERAFRLTLQALDRPSAHAMLRDVAKDPAQLGWLIQGSGIAGDATYVASLIGHMARPETARRAGEAFTLITGADLDALQLWRAQPDDFESEPEREPGGRECRDGSGRGPDVAGPGEGRKSGGPPMPVASRTAPATSWARPSRASTASTC